MSERLPSSPRPLPRPRPRSADNGCLVVLGTIGFVVAAILLNLVALYLLIRVGTWALEHAGVIG